MVRTVFVLLTGSIAWAGTEGVQPVQPNKKAASMAQQELAKVQALTSQRDRLGRIPPALTPDPTPAQASAQPKISGPAATVAKADPSPQTPPDPTAKGPTSDPAPNAARLFQNDPNRVLVEPNGNPNPDPTPKFGDPVAPSSSNQQPPLQIPPVISNPPVGCPYR